MVLGRRFHPQSAIQISPKYEICLSNRNTRIESIARVEGGGGEIKETRASDTRVVYVLK